MNQPTPLLCVVLLLTSDFWLLNSGAQGLPSFNDFARVDRERREAGHLQTTESMALMRVDSKLLDRVAKENPNDPELALGLAEWRGDWPAALEANGTNAVVVLRFACASAIKRDYETALRWFRHCQTNDTGNIVPWLGELWVLRQQGKTLDAFRPPERVADYRDYAAQAARARIRVLEKGGYTPCAARRIALMQNTFAESMAQGLSRDPATQSTAPFLLSVAQAMQRRPTLLLTEFVGQSLERVALTALPNTSREDTEKRIEELNDRRHELQQLVSTAEGSAVDLATERQMVDYFDNVLAIGEEAAMKRLSDSVRGKPTRQYPSSR